MPCMSDSTFLHIENAAHGGAFGNNTIPAPTEAQCIAGNYKVGRANLYGLPLAIEQPRGSYRTGIDAKTGKRWASRMAAHYGYISGTKGADDDAQRRAAGNREHSAVAHHAFQRAGLGITRRAEHLQRVVGDLDRHVGCQHLCLRRHQHVGEAAGSGSGACRRAP